MVKRERCEPAALPTRAEYAPAARGKEAQAKRDGRSLLRLHLDLYALVAKQMDADTPMTPSTPVSPEDGFFPYNKRMQQHAHLARLCCSAALPLARLSQQTRAATADAGRVHNTQAPIGFLAPFMNTKSLACWTTERAIGLARKVLPREATSFPRRVAVAGGAYPDAGATAAGGVEAHS